MSGMSHKIVEKIGARLAHLFAYYCIPAWIMTCQRWISQFPRRVIRALFTFFTPFVMVVKSLIITGNRFYFSFEPQQLRRELICLFYSFFKWIYFYYAFIQSLASIFTLIYERVKRYSITKNQDFAVRLSVCLFLMYRDSWSFRRFCCHYNNK